MQILVNGFIQGLLIALIAIGFSIVYNSTGIFYIAQGALYSLTPYLFFSFYKSGFNILIGLIITILVITLISIGFEVLNHRPLYKKQASMFIHLIASLGIYIAFVEIIAIIWGSETKIIREGIDKTYTFNTLFLTQSQILSGLISIFLIITFLVWLKYSENGLKLLALSDNPVQLSLLGLNIFNLRILAFGISAVITASGSLLTARDIGFDPYNGLNIVLLGIVATIIGGKGTFIGPIIGGLILGIIRTEVVWFTSSRWEDTITFILLVLFLFFRPQGIFGKKGRVENS